MNNSQKLYQAGQAIWYDNIERGLLDSGEFERMVSQGEVYGVTSNPSIFNNAISKSDTYDRAIAALAGRKSPSEIFFSLAIEDIQRAADALLPVYESTWRKDGYVSLEVDPFLAHDTRQTIEQVQRLWDLVARPNLMVKIPATLAGLPAIEASIAAGINVNVTLIFSLDRYEKVMAAYLDGLHQRLTRGLPIDQIHSVASFFISRIDTKVDKQLLAKIDADPAEAPALQSLLGKAAIANAHQAYDRYLRVFAPAKISDITAKGGNRQRPLWASTSTKNPAYSEVLYVETLVADNTVNTVPPATLTALLKQLEINPFTADDITRAGATLAAIEAAGISMDQVTSELETEGVKAFADAFQSLLNTIEERAKAVLVERDARREGMIAAIHAHQPDLWSADPAAQAEISQRLGWLEAPETSRSLLPVLDSLKTKVSERGFTTAVLLGMGGSSLAPEVIASVFATQPKPAGSLELIVLDSTSPDKIAAVRDRIDLARTLFIVASKSGSTTEVRVLQTYFWNLVTQQFGKDAGAHFIAITDPGSAVEKFGRENGFLEVINADPTIGGRFSALIAFGLVPASLIGVDVSKFLDAAAGMAEACKKPGAARNPGARLGFLMANQAASGRDKLFLKVDEPFSALGAWLEQLIAESTGKAGKGILPVPIKAFDEFKEKADAYLVHIQAGAASKLEDRSAMTLQASSPYDLAALFYQWEFATAVACADLGINAFDQPNVQDTKSKTQLKAEAFKRDGQLPWGPVLYADDQVEMRTANLALHNLTPEVALAALIALAKSGDYIAINAFVPDFADYAATLEDLRTKVAEVSGLPVTLGFGPRFLHSTGQLHKGGANNGWFIVITQTAEKDIDIPDEGMSFGTLLNAQALGDIEALAGLDRRVLHLHFSKPGVAELAKLVI